MYESYIKEVPIVDLKKEDYDESIIQSITESQKRLELAHKNFEYARGELVDYYAYQIKSEQSKISYLLKQAKKFNTKKLEQKRTLIISALTKIS